MHPIRFAQRKIENTRFRAYDVLRVKRNCIIGGEVLKVEAQNPGEAYRIRRYMSNEPDTVQWLTDYVRPGQVFFDIGANIGLYSLFVAKRLNGQVKVYSFEPESQNYAALNKNVHLNNLSDSVTTLCMAVSDSNTINRFYVRGHLRAGESIHQFGHSVDQRGNVFVPVHQQGMIGVPIDSLCGDLGLPAPNHIKIDVDGHEYAVIKGMVGILADPQLLSVQIEITELPANVNEVREIYKLFQDHGFKIAASTPVTPGVARSESYNVLFIRGGQS